MAYVELPSGKIVFLLSMEMSPKYDAKKIQMCDGTAVIPGSPDELLVNGEVVKCYKSTKEAQFDKFKIFEWLREGGQGVWRIKGRRE